MFNIKSIYTIFGLVTFLHGPLSVSGQRLTIQPNTISVSGGTTATSTPEVVTMDCSPDGLPVNTVFSMYIKRDSVSFAEVVTGKPATISTYAPNDIKSKSPTVDGSINVNSPLASTLKVTFLISRMNCADEATYQCYINYKPEMADSAQASSNGNLNVNVLPRDLQISAAMAQDYNLTPIQNQSIIDPGEQVEFSCTGYVGDSQTTVIEWYRKTLPNMFFQRFYPTQAGDTIDDGFPSSSSCEYTRTSKLRFTMTSMDNARTAFRCEVGAAQSSGAQYRVHSQEFHISPGNNPTNGVTTIPALTAMALWAVNILVFVIIW